MPDTLRHFLSIPLPITHHSYDNIANARLLHGSSKNGRPRTYDIATSTKTRTRPEYRASLVVYDEAFRTHDKIDVDSKVLTKSPAKLSLNLAMEELLKKMQEELWT
jgi:hypothetical protein